MNQTTIDEETDQTFPAIYITGGSCPYDDEAARLTVTFGPLDGACRLALTSLVSKRPCTKMAEECSGLTRALRARLSWNEAFDEAERIGNLPREVKECPHVLRPMHTCGHRKCDEHPLVRTPASQEAYFAWCTTSGKTP